MHSDDVIISSSSNVEFSAAVLESLLAVGINARILPPQNVTPADLNGWVSNPSHGFIVVSKVNYLAAYKTISRVSRACQKCDAFILAEDRNCRRCGARHSEPPQAIDATTVDPD